MKSIPFKAAMELLDNYLLADSMILCSPEIHPDKTQMNVMIQTIFCCFKEWNNLSVKVQDNKIFLIDSNGDEWSFEVLTVKTLDLTDIPHLSGPAF